MVITQRSTERIPVNRLLLSILIASVPACSPDSVTPPTPTPTPIPTASPSPTPEQAIFVLRACATEESAGESFRIMTGDPAVIATATSLIGNGHRLLVAGSLRSGDGGFNNPWHWHLAPEDVTFAEAAVELCDGCPHDVENNPTYWLNEVGRFCPWTTEVLAREH